jgi:hypothetical protein
MRQLLALLALLAAAGAAPLAAAERPDAQMLLDLDLLRETDPRARPVAERLSLLEFLRRLHAPASAAPAPGTLPEPKRAC